MLISNLKNQTIDFFTVNYLSDLFCKSFFLEKRNNTIKIIIYKDIWFLPLFSKIKLLNIYKRSYLINQFL